MRAPARRQHLLDVATVLAVERGFHAVSVEAIARRAGVTRAVIYRHFTNLHTLLEECIDRETSRAMAQVSRTALAELGEGDTTELMLTSLGSYLQAVREHPTTWRLVLFPPEGAPEGLRHNIAAGREAVLTRLTAAVRPALRHGDASDAELTARVLSAVADEYARLVLTAPDRYPPDRLLVHAREWLDRPRFGLDGGRT
jgi:AcrR family transcriptional regulator